MTRKRPRQSAAFPERKRRASLGLLQTWNINKDKRHRPKIRAKHPRRGTKSLAHPNVGDAVPILRRMEERESEA